MAVDWDVKNQTNKQNKSNSLDPNWDQHSDLGPNFLAKVISRRWLAILRVKLLECKITCFLFLAPFKSPADSYSSNPPEPPEAKLEEPKTI